MPVLKGWREGRERGGEAADPEGSKIELDRNRSPLDLVFPMTRHDRRAIFSVSSIEL
jgi:hypothetical protein